MMDLAKKKDGNPLKIQIADSGTNPFELDQHHK